MDKFHFISEPLLFNATWKKVNNFFNSKHGLYRHSHMLPKCTYQNYSNRKITSLVQAANKSEKQ